MKTCFTSIIFAFICFLVLPFVSPAVATAVDDDSDFKLSPQFQKRIDDAPPEQRESLRKQLVETQKQQQQMLVAVKKMAPRFFARLPELLDRFADDEVDNSAALIFMSDAVNRQEFRDYIGIDKETAENIRKKQMEARGNNDGDKEMMLKIAQASADAEVDKLLDEMLDRRMNATKAVAAVVEKELNHQQIKKLKELRMVNSSSNDRNGSGPPFDFVQYESLGLTDEQQKKISVIKTEYWAAMEPLVRKVMDIERRKMENRLAELESADQEIIKKQSEDIKKEMEEANQPIIKLNAATRARILALFTQEQTAKLEKVLNNAPNYLAERVGLIKEGEKNGEWRPNENSWKPGDGATPQFLEQQRQNPTPKRDRQFPIHE
ncbi:hypothetical protein FACS189443_5180 [Planctomycetales bacterium]|nr:hypothetical protein FACS189443_5180 [Planctomycetales bacterium]